MQKIFYIYHLLPQDQLEKGKGPPGTRNESFDWTTGTKVKKCANYILYADLKKAGNGFVGCKEFDGFGLFSVESRYPQAALH